MTTEGRKDDQGKLPWSLLPLGPVTQILRVLQWAAYYKEDPYGPDNWKHVPDAERRYYDAAMRHLTEWWQRRETGQDTGDTESGLPLLAHVGCCILFLLWFEKNPSNKQV